MTNFSEEQEKRREKPVQPPSGDNPIGIYIHVPFCASKCGYCDFYSRVRQDQKAGYLAALEREIRGYAGKGIRADSVFFGVCGGKRRRELRC